MQLQSDYVSGPTQKLTAHEVIDFYVFKGLHNSVEFKSWTMANEDRLRKSDICSFIHLFIFAQKPHKLHKQLK